MAAMLLERPGRAGGRQRRSAIRAVDVELHHAAAHASRERRIEHACRRVGALQLYRTRTSILGSPDRRPIDGRQRSVASATTQAVEGRPDGLQCHTRQSLGSWHTSAPCCCFPQRPQHAAGSITLDESLDNSVRVESVLGQ